MRSLWNFEIRYVEKPVTEVHNYLSFSIPNAHCTNIFLLIDLFDPISTLVAVHCRKKESGWGRKKSSITNKQSGRMSSSTTEAIGKATSDTDVELIEIVLFLNWIYQLTGRAKP